MLDVKTSERLAKMIAAELFTNGAGQIGDRLQLKITHYEGGDLKVEPDAGGWCRDAVVSRVAKLLIEAERRLNSM